MNVSEERAESRAAGRLTYRTGMPCKAGHWSARYTATANCVQCQRESQVFTNRKLKLLRADRRAQP